MTPQGSVFDYTMGLIKSRCDQFRNMPGGVHIGLSGGRSSATLLALLLELHGGKLPSNYHAIFTNTGKEHAATYEYLKAIQENWGVPIQWLELTAVLDRDHISYKQVDYASASRKGEPFQAVLRDVVITPRRDKRLCTFYMKSMLADTFCVEAGLEVKHKLLGFRADEKQRLWRMQMRCGKQQTDWTPYAPLVNAGIEKGGVLDFWKGQPFDLQIPSKWGNCDFCFMKGRGKLLKLGAEDPAALQWWIDNDEGRLLPSGQRLYMLANGGYAGLKAEIDRRNGLLLPEEEDDDGIEDLECGCTD